MVAGLMVHAADKSTAGLEPLRERRKRCKANIETLFDVGVLYLSFTVCNLEIAGERMGTRGAPGYK